MGSSLIVKQNEKVSSFDAKKLVSFRTAEPFRTTVCQFQIGSGKYSLLPICTDSMTGYYKIRLYFNTEEVNIQFHSEYQRNTILSYGKSRSALYKSDIKSNALTTQIMTPYCLDSILNKQSKKSVIFQQKQLFEKKGIFYEDNAPESESSKHKIVSGEQIEMTETNKYESLMGIDGNEELAPSEVCHQVLE